MGKGTALKRSFLFIICGLINYTFNAMQENTNSRFEKALQECDATNIRRFANSWNVNKPDAQGFTPLFIAASTCACKNSTFMDQMRKRLHHFQYKYFTCEPHPDAKETIDALIKKGAHVDQKAPDSCQTPLFAATAYALGSGDTTMLEAFLENGADPYKSECSDGVTPFKMAQATKEHPYAKKVLKIFSTSYKSLRAAVQACNMSEVKKLVNKDNVDQLDDKDQTPLFYAITNCRCKNKNTPVILDELLSNGANANQLMPNSQYGTTLIHAATTIALAEKELCGLEALLNYGANPYRESALGVSPASMTKALLQEGSKEFAYCAEIDKLFTAHQKNKNKR